MPTAFITGAAAGQGRATALKLAKDGFNIVGVDVAKQLPYPAYKSGSGQLLESLKKEVEACGVGCLPVAADVRSLASLQQAADDGVKRFGSLDVLFNNAGICAYGLSHELSEDEWDTMININLKGSWLAGKVVIPQMIKQKSGVIINNSSVGGRRGMNRLSHYATSKWGMVGLTKSWALELAPHNIRVLSIHPTGVNTPMNDGLAELEGLTPREVAERSAGNLMPVPWIEPEDVAELVAFLVSDRARFMTGSQIDLDAGLLTR
jgi:NAD(P)-dependent dehydrogenase (short-subunit alcohol dehydrogenase family)